MKKLISIILITTLLLSMAIIPGYAQGSFMPPGLAKKGGLPPGIAKKFLDIDGFQWAKNAIEKMAEKGIIKGVDEKNFAPASSVTKVEALAMIMRVLEWEDDANAYKDLITKGKKDKKVKGEVQDWGIGYVELAEEIGLLDEVDILQRNFNTPATRQEVAKYIIRALDIKDDDDNYVEEADENMNAKLRFKDASAVQTGAVGYVYLIDKLGIMVGNTDNAFQPNKPVTRAEMAMLVDRLDGKVESDINGRVTGVITDIEDDEIEIKVNSRETVYELANNFKVYSTDNKEIGYRKLGEGMTVKLYLEDNEVVKIQVITKTETVNGKFVDYDDDDEQIIIRVNNTNKSYDLNDKVKVYINDKRVDWDDLEDLQDELEDLDLDATVELTLENGEVTVIKYKYNDDDFDFDGKITNIYNSEEKITVKSGSKSQTFNITNITDIEVDGDNADFDELVVGMEVELKIENGKLVELYAKSFEKVYEGKLIRIEGGAQNKITIKMGTSEKTFVVDKDVEIEIDDDDASFADLFNENSSYIEVETVNDIVVKIVID